MGHREMLIVLFLSFFSSVTFGNSGITYHGRLLKSDGTPVDASVVQFKIEVRTPGAENCLLYSETHTLDMSASSGVFAITLNDGTASSVNTEPFTLDRAFQNRGPFSFALGKCAIGNTYNPNTGDGRKLAVSFNDNSFAGFEALPAQSINFVPMSMESLTVGGYNSGSLLRVNDGTGAPASISALSFSQYNSFLDLLAGTSALYLTSSSSLSGANLAAGSVDDAKIASGISASKISGNISGNAAGFTGSLNGDVTGAQGATSVVKLRGRDIDTAPPTNGQVLKWSAPNSRWEAQADNSGAGTVTSVTSTGSIVMTGTAADPIVGVQDATIAQKGVVQLSANGGTTAGQVVQANDSRLSDSRAPTAHTHVVDEITSATGKYLTYKPNNVQCSDGQVLKWINANQRWECASDAGAAGTVASLTVNTPMSNTGTVSDPVLSISDASTSAKGVVQLATSAQTTAGLAVQASDTRLSDSRAPSGAAGGDLSNTYPNPKVVKIQGSDVASATPLSGQFMKFGASSWTPSAINLSDLKSSVAGPLFNSPACGSNETLSWNSGTDQFSCIAISLNANAITAGTMNIARLPVGTVSGTVAAGDDSRLSDSRAPSGAAGGDLSGTYPNPTLAATGTAGTYYKVTTDSKGRVTSGVSSLNYNDLSNAAASYLSYKPNNTACANNEVLKWDNTNTRWACGTDLGLTSESDPKVGANTTNYLSKWNGSALVASGINESSGNVGIGTATPGAILHVVGSSGATLKIVDGNQGAGKVLTSDANGQASWQAAAGGGSNGQLQKQIFTASGTFTTPAGTSTSTVYKFTIVGAGGGAAGYASTYSCYCSYSGCSTCYAAGSSGGAGGTAIYYGSGVAASTNVTVTVGSGGGGGGATAAGSAGGASTVVFNGTTVTANGGGGGGGGNGSSGGAGGTCSNGTMNITGGSGEGTVGNAWNNGSSVTNGCRAGGASSFGGGGCNAAGAAYGSGGGSKPANATGGAGAAGVVMVEWIQ